MRVYRILTMYLSVSLCRGFNCGSFNAFIQLSFIHSIIGSFIDSPIHGTWLQEQGYVIPILGLRNVSDKKTDKQATLR